MDSLLQSIQMTSSCIEFPHIAQQQQIIEEPQQNIPLEEEKDRNMIEEEHVEEEHDNPTKNKAESKKKTNTKTIKKNVDVYNNYY